MTINSTSIWLHGFLMRVSPQSFEKIVERFIDSRLNLEEFEEVLVCNAVLEAPGESQRISHSILR
jgi:hypothetical protein